MQRWPKLPQRHPFEFVFLGEHLVVSEKKILIDVRENITAIRKVTEDL